MGMRGKNIMTEGKGTHSDRTDTAHSRSIHEEGTVAERWATDSDQGIYFYSRQQIYGFIKGQLTCYAHSLQSCIDVDRQYLSRLCRFGRRVDLEKFVASASNFMLRTSNSTIQANRKAFEEHYTAKKKVPLPVEKPADQSSLIKSFMAKTKVKSRQGHPWSHEKTSSCSAFQNIFRVNTQRVATQQEDRESKKLDNCKEVRSSSELHSKSEKAKSQRCLMNLSTSRIGQRSQPCPAKQTNPENSSKKVDLLPISKAHNKKNIISKINAQLLASQQRPLTIKTNEKRGYEDFYMSKQSWLSPTQAALRQYQKRVALANRSHLAVGGGVSSNALKTDRVLIVDMRGSEVFEDRKIKNEQMKLRGKKQLLREERRKKLLQRT